MEKEITTGNMENSDRMKRMERRMEQIEKVNTDLDEAKEEKRRNRKKTRCEHRGNTTGRKSCKLQRKTKASSVKTDGKPAEPEKTIYKSTWAKSNESNIT